MTAMVASKEDLSTWDNFQWRKRMEAFGHDDEAVIATGPGGEAEGIWQVCRKRERVSALSNGLLF
jgi:acid phosphatase